MLADLPPEILLHILSYLDLPELAALSAAAARLRALAADPLLHRTRLRVVAPAQLAHALFAADALGTPLRPTILELAQRGVFQGLHLDRIVRLGLYLYSPVAARNYTNALRLQRQHVADILTSSLRAHPHAPARQSALQSIDADMARLTLARSLLPALRDLKWSLRRDRVARVLRASATSQHEAPAVARSLVPTMHALQWSLRCDRLARMVRAQGERPAWLAAHGGRMGESERLRLAVCPSVKKIVAGYERMALSSTTTH